MNYITSSDVTCAHAFIKDKDALSVLHSSLAVGYPMAGFFYFFVGKASPFIAIGFFVLIDIGEYGKLWSFNRLQRRLRLFQYVVIHSNSYGPFIQNNYLLNDDVAILTLVQHISVFPGMEIIIYAIMALFEIRWYYQYIGNSYIKSIQLSLLFNYGMNYSDLHTWNSKCLLHVYWPRQSLIMTVWIRLLWLNDCTLSNRVTGGNTSTDVAHEGILIDHNCSTNDSFTLYSDLFMRIENNVNESLVIGRPNITQCFWMAFDWFITTQYRISVN